MKVSCFTYMRNSFKYGYPVIESIKSVLPICDEFIAVVGKGDDGTREAIVAIGSPKIRIIDTEWDPKLTTGGKIFAQQANIGLKAVTGDWAFHIQSDEVIHEDDLPELKKAMTDNLNNKDIEGFLFNYLHFIGDYKHIAASRRWHRREIRIIRNDPRIFSYRDSQGFRKYNSERAYINGEKGEKLNVKVLNARIFHYSYCRNPYLLLGKTKKFLSYYNDNRTGTEDFKEQDHAYDFNCVTDVLLPFKGTQPAVMQNLVANQDWVFKHDPTRSAFTRRQKFLHKIEKITGWRVGEYKNYKLIK